MSDPMQRIEGLVRALESGADATTRTRSQELVAALLEVHATCLAQLARALPSERLLELARDPLVEHVLLLHGLHPRSAAERLEAALGRLRAEGHEVRLAGVEERVARIRAAELSPLARRHVEEALLAAAPDLDRFELEAERRLPVAP